tara:strand:- start:8009 stop:8872 length:864 start_codon:yes stop_codon:yes gene_type:complete
MGFATWYFFIKPYDYLVSFKVNTYPGVVNQTIKTWSNTMENSKIIKSDDVYHIEQQLNFSDKILRYNWVISPISDSTSKVNVYITDIKNSLKNKARIPFFETTFEKDTRERLLDFNKNLKLHLSDFKVKVVGREKLKSSYIMYIPIKTTQLQKAAGMMSTFPILDNLMTSNSDVIKSDGRPFLEITYWNQKNDSLHYNFCYPIIKTDSLPKGTEINYKYFKEGDMLKAVYNGNYITSDRAWYKLLDYAKDKRIEIIKKPIEVFFNNPNFGGDALEWKTEVFLPLKIE